MMDFRYYNNMLSEGTKQMASWLAVFGLGLIGVGYLIFILRDLFAMIFTCLFCMAGIWCILKAVKLYFSIPKIDDGNNIKGDAHEHRKNVNVFIKDDFD